MQLSGIIFNQMRCFVLLATWITLCAAPVYGATDFKAPEPLAPWVDWVLHDHEEQLSCSPLYNNGAKVQCSWPSEIQLTLDHRGGTFQQSWYVESKSRVLLPGNARHWPTKVTVDDQPVVVVSQNKSPVIVLQPGQHSVDGSFSWIQLPEFLPIPIRSALVSLSVNNRKIEFPTLDETGRLWLKTTRKDEKIEDRLKVESFRLVDDQIPQQLTLYATLDVAGSAREITLGPLYSAEKFTPISLVSSLPAKLEPAGKMRLQVRPGRYSLTLKLRHNGSLQALAFEPPADGFWPQQEIWSFQARPNLRIVEIEGVTSIDPHQTNIPQNWQKFPAYRMLPGDTMSLKEIKRGDPRPAPDQLSLERTLWLSFDGSGYTIQDTIQGQKNTNWRLEMRPDITLGRVAVDGVEQFITRQKDSSTAGVELRKGNLNLIADSSYNNDISTLPATGWEHQFQSVTGKLLLPPGWKLINASGIDNIPRTWVKRWTLLDFFIVLIFTIAAAKIFSRSVAAVGLVTLTLLYHEPGAPVYIWLALLIGFTLLKQLPDGKFKNLVKLYQAAGLLLLIVTAIPYSIQAIRVGMYPQLENPWVSMTDYGEHTKRHRQVLAPPPREEAVDEAFMEQDLEKPQAKLFRPLESRTPQMAAPLKQKSDSGQTWSSGRGDYYQSRVTQYDPKALTQTGPGLPQWRPFETIHYSWSGPVSADQTVSFVLLGPRTNLILSFIRVFLIIALALGMCGGGFSKPQGLNFSLKKMLLPALLITFLFSTPGISPASDIPSPEMLDTLKMRLLEKDECFPECADFSELTITIEPEELTIVAQVDVQVNAAVPLPGNMSHWIAQEVLIDQQPAKGLFRINNGLWVLLEPGKHTVLLKGGIRRQNTLQLPFPLKPHRISVNATGWSVEGLHGDGDFDSQLQFKRILKENNSQVEILETGVLPSFAVVERKILLGLVWKVETSVRRISPPGAAMILDIPLLPGESVTTHGIHVDKTTVKVNLRANQTFVKWESFLTPSDTIVLRHPLSEEWAEVWKVDVSPVFHMEYSGIPVILHKTGEHWHPTWRPWPGEELVLNVSRPEGMGGQTLTVEKSRLELRPGLRSGTAKLTLTIKSSQGGQHTITLPPEASLQEIKIGGVPQPIRQEGRNVVIPVTPGSQQVELQWQESSGITTLYKTTELDLGVQSVNAAVDVYLPRNRWPLFMGGEHLAGPAVLFWSVIIIVFLVAFALARTGLTPLKFHHWFLLGIGMSMSDMAACLFVVGWLMALEFRPKSNALKRRYFNLIQAGIGFLTLLALASLVFAISQGLLGSPDMNIVGNGSRNGLLRWYHDISGPILPQAWVFSIPMLVYHLAMLAWALWISFGLISILKWGWKRFAEPIIWVPKPPGDKDKYKEKDQESDQK